MLLLISNSIGVLAIAGLILYGKLMGVDGYGILSVSVLFYVLMGNLLYLAFRWRIKKGTSISLEFVLFVLMIFIGNSITYSQRSLLCTIECFGVDIVFFDILLFILSFLIFIGCFLYTTKGKQRIIGSIILVFLIGVFAYSPASHWYRENVLITRFSTSEYYYKDRNEVYCTYFMIFGDTILSGANVDSFVALDDLYAKDKNNVYYACNVFTSADVKTFEVIPGKTPHQMDLDLQENIDGAHYIQTININYSKDKNQVFFLNKIVEGANPETFKSLGNGYAQDGNNYYFEGNLTTRNQIPKTLLN